VSHAGDELGERLSAYLDNEVSAGERAELEDILAKDSAARALFAELRRMRDAVASLPRATAARDLVGTITSRLEREALLGPPDEALLRPGARRSWGTWSAAAALIVLAVGAGLYVSLNRNDVTGTTVVTTNGSAKSLPEKLEAPVLEPSDGAATAIRDLSKAFKDAMEKTATEPKADEVDQFALAERSPVATRSLGAAPAGSSDSRTLEQKLSEGADVACVTEHHFDNEPLRLRVEFSASTQQAEFARELRSTLARRQVMPVLQESKQVQSGATSPLAGGVGGRVAENSQESANSLVYFEGSPTSNYLSTSPGQQQMLVRLPAEALPEVVELAEAEAAKVELEVGGLSARDRSEVRNLAQQTAGMNEREFLGGFVETAADSNGKEKAGETPIPTRDEPAPDMLDVLARLGFPINPAALPIPVASAPAPMASEEASPDRELADAQVGPEPARPASASRDDGDAQGPVPAQEPGIPGSENAPQSPQGMMQDLMDRTDDAEGAKKAETQVPLPRSRRGGMRRRGFDQQQVGQEPEPVTLVIDMRPAAAQASPTPEASTNGQ
jgi:hypothetical protein